MTRTKLFTAAVVLTGILAAGASTVLPLATAQRPLAPVNSLAEEKGAVPGVPRPAQSSAADSRHPAQYDNVAAPAAKGQWEYKFIPRKSDSLEAFERLLNDYAAAGWEYCDTVSLIVTDPRRKEEWGTNPTIVFKRPVKGYRAAMSGMMGQQNEMLGLNNSMRPTPTGEPLIMPGQPGDASSAKPMKPGSEKGTPAIGANDIFVIRLAHAEAVSLAKTLVDLFKNSGCRIVAETRTNALLVQGDAETVKAVASVVEKVDTPAPPKSGPK